MKITKPAGSLHSRNQHATGVVRPKTETGPVKTVASSIQRKTPGAPPVYRPQPTPKVLQRKSNPNQAQPNVAQLKVQAHAANQSSKRVVASPVHRVAQAGIAQPKVPATLQRSKVVQGRASQLRPPVLQKKSSPATPAAASKQRVIQLAKKYQNKANHRIFTLSVDAHNGEINMTESDFTASTHGGGQAMSGYLLYKLFKGVGCSGKTEMIMGLKTVSTTPEEGTQIGPVLMMKMGEIAKRLHIETIVALTIARDKETYYAKFGFNIYQRRHEMREKMKALGVTDEEVLANPAVGEASVSTDVFLSRVKLYVNKTWHIYESQPNPGPPISPRENYYWGKGGLFEL